MHNEPLKKWKTGVKLDYQGYAAAGGDSISRSSYLWIGEDNLCYTHTSSLQSLRKLHALIGAIIDARTAPPKKRRKRS